MTLQYSNIQNLEPNNDPLFQFISTTALEMYGTGDFDLIKFKKNQFLFRENLTPQGLYFIQRGYVKVFKAGVEGKEKILRLYGPGEFIGYKELLSDTRYTSTAFTLEDVELYFIPKTEFIEIINSNPDFKNQFIVRLCMDLMTTEDKLVDIAYRPVRGRLADVLLEMAEKHPNARNVIRISLSREDLARLVGTAKETVIRLLSEFKKERLIDTDGRMITLMNLNGMQRIREMYD